MIRVMLFCVSSSFPFRMKLLVLRQQNLCLLIVENLDIHQVNPNDHKHSLGMKIVVCHSLYDLLLFICPQYRLLKEQEDFCGVIAGGLSITETVRQEIVSYDLIATHE